MVVQIEKLRRLRDLQRLERVFPRVTLRSHSSERDDPIMQKLHRLQKHLRALKHVVHVPDEPA